MTDVRLELSLLSRNPRKPKVKKKGIVVIMLHIIMLPIRESNPAIAAISIVLYLVFSHQITYVSRDLSINDKRKS